MPASLTDTLVVGISATALFDLREAQAYFAERRQSSPATAVADYRDWMREREQLPLVDGTAMPLVRALLALNVRVAGGTPCVEVVVLSRNSAETGLQVLHNIRRLGLPIARHAFTGGESVVPWLGAFAVDLFLTTDAADAQRVIDEGGCAAAVLRAPPEQGTPPPDDQLRIAFDGDAVLFADHSEQVYKSEGLAAFHRNEDTHRDVPLAAGPHAQFLKKLAGLQARLAGTGGELPMRIALVTARSAPAELRVVNTLRHWGVQVDAMFFLGGVSKEGVLRAFRPHIFFDDQDVHLDAAAPSVSVGKVPWRSDSPLHLHAKTAGKD